MIGFAKRATAALMAVAVVFGTLFLEPVFNKDNTTVNAAALYDSASLVNYATIMGRAVDYGIVSRSFTQRQHIETTLATYKFCLEQNTVFDVDLTTSRTAQFMVGEIGGSQNKMIFDTVTHDQHPAYVENINITLADDIDMSGKVLCLKKAKAFYFIYCYYRKALEKESLETIRRVFDTISWD